MSYLDAANARGLLALFFLELVSGLRKGELVALLWTGRDAPHRSVSVSEQYINNPYWNCPLPSQDRNFRVSIPQEVVAC